VNPELWLTAISIWVIAIGGAIVLAVTCRDELRHLRHVTPVEPDHPAPADPAPGNRWQVYEPRRAADPIPVGRWVVSDPDLDAMIGDDVNRLLPPPREATLVLRNGAVYPLEIETGRTERPR
jgi:hypothetical protein